MDKFFFMKKTKVTNKYIKIDISIKKFIYIYLTLYINHNTYTYTFFQILQSLISSRRRKSWINKNLNVYKLNRWKIITSLLNKAFVYWDMVVTFILNLVSLNSCGTSSL